MGWLGLGGSAGEKMETTVLEQQLKNILDFLNFIYLLLERGEGGRKRGRETSMCERKINWLPLAHPQLGTWPTTQACVLTGN